jgi:hypothetical protein
MSEDLRGIFRTTACRDFVPAAEIGDEYVRLAFDFAHAMSFGGKGVHRCHRTGGREMRRNAQIFCDAFNGKLGEFAVYQYFASKEVPLPMPDIGVYGRNIWDSSDFLYSGRRIGVKTTKKYAQLLLLEQGDWNARGQYIPNVRTGEGNYSALILVRTDSEVVEDLKKKRYYYADRIPMDIIECVAKRRTYTFDIPGAAPRDLLLEAIRGGYTIPQGAYLNSFETQMDAANYYIQTGDLVDVNQYIELLKG